MDYPILENIGSPQDVKNLPEDRLDSLCDEIRNKMIETVSKNGGHLASNLGTVELTVALHRCFSEPDDKIIWDVSHQSYAHKLLTGRFASFDTLRTQGGISGFTRPDESPYDISYEGHAGTSVSRAAGIAAANRIKGNKNYAVAVIGDGSFGNGLVYEAMNAAGSKGGRLIVILNDNEMSINRNVGALARYLATVRAKPEYYRFKAGAEKALNHIPLIGVHLSNGLFKIKTFLKNLIYRSSFFEDLGFRYIGPIDGHDIPTLCEAMSSAKMVGKPVLLHVNTVKGRGCDFAENSPENYHGVSEFNLATGESRHSDDSYSSQFGKALCEFASKDSRICAVTAAMTKGTGLEEFFEQYPSRSFDAGIAEGHALVFSSGLSAAGQVPVFAVYSTFLQRAADQLIHDGALQRKKIILGIDRAGFVGEDGETHQGLFDVALMQSLPNTTVYSPASYSDLRSALYNALYKDENLVAVRYPRGSMPEGGDELTSPGEYEVYGDENAPYAVVTYGRLFFEAVKAVKELSAKGISVKVIKLCKIIPLPEECESHALDCRKVFFFEEGMKNGGVGEEFSCRLMQNGFGGKYIHTGVDREFVSHAGVDYLMEKYGLDSASMVRLIEIEDSNERENKA